MAIERAFRKDVVEHPEDDTPRLVYADWLEEHGDRDRAELIRVQVELARLGRYDPRRPALARREAALLAEHGARWLAADGLEELVDPRFRRGFVEHAQFDEPEEFLDRARRLFTRAPLSSLAFQAAGELEDSLPPVGLRRLVRSKHVLRLRRLEFHTIDELSGEDLAALDHLPSHARLEELDLSDNSLDDEDCAALVRCAFLGRLRVLSLAENNLDVETMRHLAACPHLASLRTLDLTSDGRWRIEAEGVAALTASPYLTALTELRLTDHHIGGEGLSLLAHWPGLGRLVCLGLSHNFGGDTAQWHRDPLGMRDLVESPHWGDLRELDVSGGTLRDLPTLEMFLSSPKIASLRVLRLGEFGEERSGQRQDEAARLVAAAPHLGGLIELRFENVGLSAAAEELLRDRFGDRLTLVEWGR